MDTKLEATLDDLYHIPEHSKAELVNGELVLMLLTGGLPGYAAAESLSACAPTHDKPNQVMQSRTTLDLW